MKIKKKIMENKFNKLIKHIADKKQNLMVFGDVGRGKFNAISDALYNVDKQVINCNQIMDKEEIDIILDKNKNTLTIFDNIDKAMIDVQNACFEKACKFENTCIFVANTIDDFDYVILNKMIIFDYNEITN